ncbi:hypothetical protein [Haloarcula onubensis]|uniref:Uncharacterized protein n=1 Tax=Haloarcula onubensis TaxID=2950539 RepID=A0ABU2FMY5_9EURY|nr:hypothetical protein [Halomicroarcula sp. S3CR25-11]MDS0281657.1 hypothetical protein [Halomicroarcula sp. S3CR25-11]
MSLIPLDQPRGDGPNSPGDGPEDASLLGRFLSGCKAALLALPGVSALASDRDDDRSEPTLDATERERSSERKAPATLPAGSATGEVEVVSTETDDTLTVEAVDNPDATISSDTWEPVER